MKASTTPVLLAVLLIASGMSPAESGKPEIAKAASVTRKITVKIVASNGTTTSEVTVPALESTSPSLGFEVSATLEATGMPDRIVEIDCRVGADQLRAMGVSVESQDRPTLAGGGNELAVSASHTLFRVSSLYSGPGEYEIYSNPKERMNVTVK